MLQTQHLDLLSPLDYELGFYTKYITIITHPYKYIQSLPLIWLCRVYQFVLDQFSNGLTQKRRENGFWEARKQKRLRSLEGGRHTQSEMKCKKIQSLQFNQNLLYFLMCSDQNHVIGIWQPRLSPSHITLLLCSSILVSPCPNVVQLVVTIIFVLLFSY